MNGAIMAQTYAFQISMPVTDLLPRNRMVNRIHMQHVVGGLLDTDLKGITDALAQLYQTRYQVATKEVDVRAYDTDAAPNYPRATTIVNAGQAWTLGAVREVALCLSYSGPNRGNKNERGRIYLCPGLHPGFSNYSLRPDTTQMTWASEWYTKSNESFPDIGGVDWKFGVWSKLHQTFRQTTQWWVNDDWDIQRRRGLRESTRLSGQRDG
jgi:hypothetical protein